jgi:ribosome-binding protein aMBF1 (putative translation factor)
MLEQLSNRLIGYRVRAAREAVGWNQEQLATSLGPSTTGKAFLTSKTASGGCKPTNWSRCRTS